MPVIHILAQNRPILLGFTGCLARPGVKTIDNMRRDETMVPGGPWFQEAGGSRIGENDVIALDTDVVGCRDDYAEAVLGLPEKYHSTRHDLSARGFSIAGEYPYRCSHCDFPIARYRGAIEFGMSLRVENRIGASGGSEGTRRERQGPVADPGWDPLPVFLPNRGIVCA